LAATIPGYSDSISLIVKDEQAEMAALQQSYIEYLDGFIKSSLSADKLDDAKRAREERDTITTLLAASPKGGIVGKPERDPTAKTVVTSKAPDAPAAAPEIPAAALAYKGSRYLLQTGASSWADARTACEKAGGHLLIINDDAELDFVGRKLMVDVDAKVLIGASFDGLRWTWVDGTRVAKEQFTLNPVQDAVAAIMVQGKEPRFKVMATMASDDNRGNRTYPYLCEWEGQTAPPGQGNTAKNGSGANVSKERVLTIIKATVAGPRRSVDVTQLLRDRVVDGILDVGASSFVNRGYRIGQPATLTVKYQYKNEPVKTVKYADRTPFKITE
jgi:hypothetical protein